MPEHDLPGHDLLADRPVAMAGPVRACASGALPPNVMLMQLVQTCRSAAELESILRQALDDLKARSEPHGRLLQAQRLWVETPQAWETIKAVLNVSGRLDHGGSADVASWSKAFDRLAEISPDASVALYSLGRSDLLDQATSEIVDLLRDWGCLGSDRVLLEIGCGSGRFLQPLTRQAGLVIGCDVSFGMLQAARRRFPKAILLRNSGRDLAAIRDHCVDVIYAVDVFPYLVAAGAEVAAGHVAEAGRLLKPNGQLVIFNYSYRNDAAADETELARIAEEVGLTPVPAGRLNLRYWDGRLFRFRRR